MSHDSSRAWDGEAEAFDQQPDHGLSDPSTRAAWRNLLTRYLPASSSDVADLGCGTGTLAVLLAEQGHRVHGVDFSPEMVRMATEKADRAGVRVSLHCADASDPPFPARSFDVVLCRHVLWALPDPSESLQRWSVLLRPGGRLVLIEGRWSTGAGLSTTATRALLAPLGGSIEVQPLTDDVYWGGPITDERYLIATMPSATV